MKILKIFKNEKFLLALIFILAFSLRLYKIDNPIADWHSWRQADTAAVSRNFIKYSFNPFYPRFDDLSSIPSGKENPQGWRFVEFPVFNLIHAGLFKLFDTFSLEIWGRLTAAISSLFSLLFLYLLAKIFFGKKTALLTAFFFAALPFNVYYSRVILPEPLMIAFSLGTLYFFVKFIEDKEIMAWLISCLLGILALLAKPYAVFIMGLPMAYLSLSQLLKERKDKKALKKDLLLTILYVVFLFLPFLLWRDWMKNFAEGIPANEWLFNAGNMRFKPVWWRWLFYERIGKLILGAWGTTFLILGLISKKDRHADAFFYSFLTGALLFLVIFARGNIQHDYYQALIIPALCLALGRGANLLLASFEKKSYPFLRYCLTIVCLLFTLLFSFFEVRGYYQINNPAIIEAGKRADTILPKDAKVVAPYGGDTAFLYQTNRPGWPAITGSIDDMIKLGATHYVSVNFDKDTKRVMEKYPVLEKTEKYVIVELK
ncbi:glycosyltransferase family 39 protein [Candidatus Shapirobacteria bacterium]|nr:glycosyltransferase family 39 protein [Candidatus Shapirobacteria bacterium]